MAILERLRTFHVTMCSLFGSSHEPKLLQRFNGTVLEVQASGFQARISDVTCPANSDEIAVFFLSAISPEDHHLVAPGAVFDWEVHQHRDGRTTSTIRFRRSEWSSSDIARAKRLADRWGWMLDG